jgi:hypothetical protein
MDEVIDPSLVINEEGHQIYLSSNRPPIVEDSAPFINVDNSTSPSLSSSTSSSGYSTPRIPVDTVEVVNTMPTTENIKTYCGYAKYYGEENRHYQLLATDDILRFYDRFPKNTVTVHPDGVNANCLPGRMPITEQIQKYIGTVDNRRIHNDQLEAARIAAAESVKAYINK